MQSTATDVHSTPVATEDGGSITGPAAAGSSWLDQGGAGDVAYPAMPDVDEPMVDPTVPAGDMPMSQTSETKTSKKFNKIGRASET